MVYDHPELYAAAYGFRDITGELAFCLAQASHSLGREPASLVELAAGPALHARAALRRGLRAAAVEHNPRAVAWLRAAEPDLEVVLADIAAFELAAPVDLVLCPLSGFAYLLDDDRWRSALACVAACLTPGGLLVMELSPGDARRDVVDTWQVPLPSADLEVIAGPSRWASNGVFEWDLTLRCELEGRRVELVTVERQRDISAARAQALVSAQSGLSSVRCHAGYDARRRYRGAGGVVITARRSS